MKPFTYKLGSPEAMRQESSLRDPREDHEGDEIPEGDKCIYCGKDAETCEHNERDLDWSQYADKESDAERNQ